MPINYTALKSELQNDPAALGYALHVASGNDSALADLINAPKVGVVMRNEFISSADILEAIDSRDFETTPLAAHVAWFQAEMVQGRLRLVELDGTNTRALGNIKRLLLNADPQGSEARLNVIADRLGSRAEELFGRNTVVSSTDIAIAVRETP